MTLIHRLVALGVVATSGTTLTLMAEDSQLSGRGIYRPFTLTRQVAMAIGYIVEPSIPDNAEVRHAYSLKQLKQLDQDVVEAALNEGFLQISVPLDDGTGNLTVFPHECSPEAFVVQLRDLQNTGLAAHESIYVLSERDLAPDTEERVVSWDPDEAVSVRASGPLVELQQLSRAGE